MIERVKILKRSIIGIFGVLVIGIVVITIYVLRGVDEMIWSDFAESSAKYLAAQINYYKLKNDRYPSSPSEMLSDAEFKNDESLKAMLNGRSRYRYDYRSSSNEFWITVAQKGTVLRKSRSMERHFKSDDNP